MALLGRTLAVTNKIVEDIKKLVHSITVLVSLIFLGYYGYSVVANLNKTFYLVIYSAFLLISIITFITYLATYKKKNNTKKFNRALRIIKYLLNATMLVVNGYQIFTSTYTTLSLILLIVSGVALILQVLIEIISSCIENYISLLKTAVEMDIEPIAKFFQPKKSIYEMIDSPLEKLANKIQNIQPEKSEDEEYIDTLAEQYEIVRKEKKKAKKEEEKQKREENAKEQKAEIKGHLGVIVSSLFKKKDK